MKPVSVLISLALLAGCAGAASSENELDPINNWFPGLIGVSGFTASGFGPAGYPGVQDDSIDSEPVQQFLASVLPQLIEFPAGAVRLAPKGNLISIPTFVMCGATYNSEATRLVRRKLELSNEEAVFGNFFAEAIQYESAEAVTAALDELQKVKQECSAAGVYELAGESIQVQFIEVAVPDSAELVTRENRFLVSWQSNVGAETETRLQIWQQRGNTLVVFEVVEKIANELTAADIDFAFAQAIQIAARLSAADPLDIGVFD
jgi:hypothetical protein